MFVESASMGVRYRELPYTMIEGDGREDRSQVSAQANAAQALHVGV